MSTSSDNGWLPHPHPFLLTSTSGDISQSTFAIALAKPCDFISFLGTARSLGIDFLPITWQPALERVGQGATAEVREALIALQTSFAFKRFQPRTQGTNIQIPKSGIFQALMNELLVLGCPTVRNHPNIIRLEGICWDVSSCDDNILPVLVFQKARYGDLYEFMKHELGGNLTFEARIGLCADIAAAVIYLHSELGVIHGDIKPQNVLVFESGLNRYVGQLTDFGYCSWFRSNDDLVKLPRSEPWHAPEHHHRAMPASQAKKMDVYSFGMLCLWLLFYNDPEYPSRNFDIDVKNEKSRLDVAQSLILAKDSLNSQRKGDLVRFFDIALATNPSYRSSNLEELLKQLALHR